MFFFVLLESLEIRRVTLGSVFRARPRVFNGRLTVFGRCGLGFLVVFLAAAAAAAAALRRRSQDSLRTVVLCRVPSRLSSSGECFAEFSFLFLFFLLRPGNDGVYFVVVVVFVVISPVLSVAIVGLHRLLLISVFKVFFFNSARGCFSYCCFCFRCL